MTKSVNWNDSKGATNVVLYGALRGAKTVIGLLPVCLEPLLSEGQGRSNRTKTKLRCKRYGRNAKAPHCNWCYI